MAAKKWDLPEELTSDQKKRARKLLRAEVDKGNEPNINDIVKKVLGNEVSEKPSPSEPKGQKVKELKANKGSKGSKKTTTKETVKQPKRPKFTKEEIETELISNRGLVLDPKMKAGYGLAADQVESIDSILTKFEDRWGYPAEVFRWAKGNILLLGPVKTENRADLLA